MKGSATVWGEPRHWNRRALVQGIRPRVFVASMADVFDDEVDPSWREELWELIRECSALDWLVLTKRPENMLGMLPHDWGDGWKHVWLGTTVENQAMVMERTPVLQAIPAALRFLSVEPLLGPVNLDLEGIHWVICAGESGASYRPLDPDWARGVRDQSLKHGVPFHFKQWGTMNQKKAGRLLDGVIWDDFPISPAALVV